MHGKIASRCRWGCIGRTFVWRNAALAASLSALAAGAVAGAAAATAVATPPDASANFAFQTADNSSDLTFNQLLGINDSDTIAGYFGSGMAGHPNKGYTLHVNYRNENFPGSAQTQVTGLNNGNTTVGFWVDKAGDDSGFYSIGGRRFHTADYPTADRCQAGGRPAAGGERQWRRGRVLYRRQGRQPRLFVQHLDSHVPEDQRLRRHQRYRRRD